MVMDHRAFEERFDVKVQSGYGMSEAGGVLLCQHPMPNGRTCGRPNPGFDVRLLDDDGAEAAILPLADADFAPVAFRKGTIFGFSPRMRYDLVVNSFVKDALATGKIHVHFGGAMWRPLIDVRDVARAYVTAIEADADLVALQRAAARPRPYHFVVSPADNEPKKP